jgi:hypothetical protein
MKAVFSSETLVNFYQTTQYYILKATAVRASNLRVAPSVLKRYFSVQLKTAQIKYYGWLFTI